MLAIQVVELIWTKFRRGAAFGNWRAEVPRGYVVDAMGGTPACVVQRYRLASWDGFAPELEEHEVLQHVPGTVKDLRVRVEGDDAYRLGLRGNTERRPPPGWPQVPTAVRLAPGQFVRFIVNSRHTSGAGRTYYLETTYNVAGGPAVPPDRFQHGEPDRVIDLRGHLF